MSEFASAGLTAGQLNAIVKKLGGHYMALRFLRDELVVSFRSWREKDGIIRFSVTYDDTVVSDWISRLEREAFRFGDYAKQVVRSLDFKPTSGVTTEVAILKGTLFADNDRITKNICKEADKRNLGKPEPELACLIRLKFTDKEIEEMGLWYIVAMHEPINNFGGDGPCFLYANRNSGGRWLDAFGGRPNHKWDRDSGFAFTVS